MKYVKLPTSARTGPKHAGQAYDVERILKRCAMLETTNISRIIRDPSKKRKTVLLTLTEACNLNCTYCYQDHKTSHKMSFEIAKNAILRAFKMSPYHDEIEFDLFGGEPFLCFDLIKEIVEWIRLQKKVKPYLIFINTNGTLVHG